MANVERGVIRNREQARVLRDFSGLCWGTITPTDVDAFLDFGDKLFVFIEAKYNGARLPYGQQLALERLCDACQSQDRDAILIIVRHTVAAEDDKDISCAELPVRRFRFRGVWREPQAPITLREAIELCRKRTEGLG